MINRHDQVIQWRGHPVWRARSTCDQLTAVASSFRLAKSSSCEGEVESVQDPEWWEPGFRDERHGPCL